MKSLELTKKYLKDLELLKNDRQFMKNGKDVLTKYLKQLQNGESLPNTPPANNHKMVKGSPWEGCYDVHILPNVVLIYEIKESSILLHRIGSHPRLGFC